MKRIATILVLMLFVLATGCGYYKAKKTEKEAYQTLDKVKAQSEEMNQQMQQNVEQTKQVQETQTQQTQKTYETQDKDKEDKVIRVGDEGTGLKNLGSSYREKGVTEHCDVDQPFTCMSYVASEGQVDVTLKYSAYQGALKEVTMYMNGDACDPTDSFIEPGDKQKFTCYADEDSDYFSGKFEVDYYETLKRVDMTVSGSVYVKWE